MSEDLAIVKQPNTHSKEASLEDHRFTDKLHLDEMAKQIETITSAFKDAPEKNSEKIAQIKAEIAAGQYQINTNELAKKLVTEIDLFLGMPLMEST